MTRTTRIRLIPALIAVAALTLTGCASKTDGAAQAAASTEQQETSAEAPAEEPAEEPAVESADTQADAPTESDSADAGTQEPAGSAVVGAGTLDEPSTAWFTTFCGVGKPFDDFFASAMAIASTTQNGAATPEALTTARDGLAQSFGDFGAALTGVAEGLSAMDAPTIANGDKIAANIVKGFGNAGPYLSGVAEQVSALDPSDPAAFSTELDTLMGSMGDMGTSLGVTSVDFDAALKAEVAALPGCQGSMLFSSF